MLGNQELSETSALDWITDIVREELDSDAIVLTAESTPSDVEGWDSLAHVAIVIAVQKRIGRRFTTHQIEGLESVGDLVRLADQAAAS